MVKGRLWQSNGSDATHIPIYVFVTLSNLFQANSWKTTKLGALAPHLYKCIENSCAKKKQINNIQAAGMWHSYYY